MFAVRSTSPVASWSLSVAALSQPSLAARRARKLCSSAAGEGSSVIRSRVRFYSRLSRAALHDYEEVAAVAAVVLELVHQVVVGVPT